MSKKSRRREEARLRAFRQQGVVGEEPLATEPQKVKKEPAATRGLKNFYARNYKKLMLVPYLILFLAIVQIGWQMSTTGDFLNKGISLRGGVTITIPELDMQREELGSLLKQEFPKQDIAVRSIAGVGGKQGIVIEADLLEEQQINALQELLRKRFSLTEDRYSIEIIGSALGESFFRQTFFAVLVAFLFMAIVVFLHFPIPAPCFAVIFAAVADIIITIAIVNLLGVKISTAGIAGFLMLIGYSVDTDILLTTRVLRRREGTVLDGVFSAMRTGFIMTGTTLCATAAALFFSQSEVLSQIMLIIFIGLCVDLITTWLQNAGFLCWYLERTHEA